MPQVKSTINPNLGTNALDLSISDFVRFWKDVEHRGQHAFRKEPFKKKIVSATDMFLMSESSRRLAGKNTRYRHFSPLEVSWVYHFGNIPRGSTVKNTCGHKRCLNPFHMELIAQSTRITSKKRKVKFSNRKPTATAKRVRRAREEKMAWSKSFGKLIPAFYMSAKWRDLRRTVVARDNGICQYCGDPGYMADHVIPRRSGGPDTLGNLVCCCAICNKTAGGRKFNTIAKKKSWILANRPTS